MGLVLKTLERGTRRCKRTSRRLRMLCRVLLRLEARIEGGTRRRGLKVSLLRRFIRRRRGDLRVGKGVRLVSMERRGCRRATVHELERCVLATGGRRIQSTRGKFGQVDGYFRGRTMYERSVVRGLRKRLRGTFSFVGRDFNRGRRVLLFIAKVATSGSVASFVTKGNYPTCFRRDRVLLCGGRRGRLQGTYLRTIRSKLRRR